MTYFKDNTCSLCRTILLNSTGKHGVSSIWYILKTRPCCHRRSIVGDYSKVNIESKYFLDTKDKWLSQPTLLNFEEGGETF